MSVTSAFMPWYIGDYLRDTGHLEAHEHGAYLLLIAHAWQHDGALPLDRDRIRKIAKLSQDQWARSESTIMEFWTKNGTGYRQKRVDIELPKAVARYQQKVEAGKARSAQRALSERLASADVKNKPNKINAATPADAKRLLSQSESESESDSDSESELDSKAKSKTKARAKAARPPDGVKILADLGVDEQIAKDWLAVRKAKRAPLTQTAMDDLTSEAAKAGITVQDAVRICATRSWQGFKASWLKQGQLSVHEHNKLAREEFSRRQKLAGEKQIEPD